MKQRRMKLIAIACGVLCAVCVGAFLMIVQGRANAERAEALSRYGGEQIEVCVATRDIAAGERVDISAVESRLWVSDLLPEGSVRAAGDVVGKTATSPILKGEVICEKRFANEHGVLDVPLGKEAVSVPAKAVQAVGGAIRAGMSVDVYASGDSSTSAIVKGVVVLDTSVGASKSLTSGDSGWITLAVEPDRVQEIIAAANKTTLYFVVPGGDADMVSAQGDEEAGEGASGESGSAESAESGSAESAESAGSASSASASKGEAASGQASKKDNDGEGGEEE